MRPRLIVLHYTAMPDREGALRALCDPAREVSAHYLIDRDGTVLALVDEDQRAWHAGAGAWRGCADVNSASIGIELVNTGIQPFAAPLMRALEELLGDIMARWSIPPQGVIAHSDMAPGRKIDPGGRFDWRRLARQGLAVWPEPAGPGDLCADARAFGYPDLDEALLRQAIGLRFAGCDPAAAMADLARRYGPAIDIDRVQAAV